MHAPYETEKFCYGFSVYILAHPDEAVDVGITTGSSSYSLRQMVMIGCDSTTHAARAVKRSGICSLNLFDVEAMGLFEYAGTVSGGHKLRDTHVPSSDHDGIPVLDDPQVSLLCRVPEATGDDIYTCSCCAIIQRLVGSALIDVRGRFRCEDLYTVEYMGDSRRRIYRYFSDRVGRFGASVRPFKESPLPQRCQCTMKAGDPHVGFPASFVK